LRDGHGDNPAGVVAAFEEGDAGSLKQNVLRRLAAPQCGKACLTVAAFFFSRLVLSPFLLFKRSGEASLSALRSGKPLQAQPVLTLWQP
jgi:hypothetical protein